MTKLFSGYLDPRLVLVYHYLEHIQTLQTLPQVLQELQIFLIPALLLQLQVLELLKQVWNLNIDIVDGEILKGFRNGSERIQRNTVGQIVVIQYFRPQSESPEERSGLGLHGTDHFQIIVLKEYFEPRTSLLSVIPIIVLGWEDVFPMIGVGLGKLNHKFTFFGLIDELILVLPQEGQTGENIFDVFVFPEEFGQTVQMGFVEVWAYLGEIRVEVEQVGGILGDVALPKCSFQ